MTDNGLVYDDERDTGESVGTGAGRLPLLIGISAHVKKQFYPAMLRGFLAGPQLYDPSYSHASDPDAYEVVLRDAVIRQCVDIRLRASAGREWRCNAGDDTDEAKAYADIAEDALKHIEGFTEARYQLASAVLRGTSYGLIKFKRKWCTLGGIRGNWMVPVRIDDIDPRRFRWANRDGKQFLEMARVKENIGNLYADAQWFDVPINAPMIRCVYNNDESRLGYGRGLMDALYHVAWEKGEAGQLMAEATALHARGVIEAKIDGLRSGSEKTAARSEQWIKTIQLMQQTGIIAYDSRDEFKFVPGGTEGMGLASAYIRYKDEEIRTLLLGSSLPFGGGQGTGSLARAKEEGEVHESIVQYDRDKLNEDISRDVIDKGFIARNRIELAAQNLTDVPKPEFDSVHEKKHDPKERVEIAETLLRLKGVNLRMDEVIEGAGYTVAGPDDEVIEGGQDTQQNPFGGGMFRDRQTAVK